MSSLLTSRLVTQTVSLTCRGLSGLMLIPGTALFAQDAGLASMSPADVQMTVSAQYTEGAVPGPLPYAGEPSAACLDGGAGGTCPPRRLTYGYYNPVWRRWPGDRGKTAASPTAILGTSAEPALPAPDAETDIYDPPRADESSVPDAEIPAEPSSPAGPPALPPGLDAPGNPEPTDGASQWEEVSEALSEAAPTHGPHPLHRRPLSLRRAGSGTQERFRSQARTIAQVTFEQPQTGDLDTSGAEVGPSGAWQPSRQPRSSGHLDANPTANDSGEPTGLTPSAAAQSRSSKANSEPRGSRPSSGSNAARRNPLRNS